CCFEAASLAGHLQLGNLIVVYDDNHISIDGDTAVAFTENVEQRFLSYGWQVLHVENGDTDLAGIYNAITEARQEKNKPTIIRLKTIIGFGSKQQGTHGVHGSPLKPDDIAQLKNQFGLPADQHFQFAKRGASLESDWNNLLSSYGQKYPREHAELVRRIAGELPSGWEKTLPVYKPSDPAQASRKLSEIVLTSIIPGLPELMGGSADLTGSNLTKVKGSVDFQPPSTGLGNYAGTYIRYGVREHGMGAVANGLAAYGGIIPFVATFLVREDSKLRLIRSRCSQALGAEWTSSHLATHDSIGLGEDGPTHQPIETAIHLRAIPNLAFWRPADGNETSASYYWALTNKKTPSVLSLSRQNLPNLEGSTIENALKGGYVVHDEQNEDLTIVSAGSEVSIAVKAAGKLNAEGIRTRVEYKLNVFKSVMRWVQYGLDTFGASGPYQKVYEKFGLTGSNIASVGRKVVDFYKKKGGEVVSPLLKAF
ncbi:hypothetical protein MPER_10604, partial [Moniliophthora perniciosa FA553]